MHKDGQSALAIDPGANMRGNLWSCKADNEIRLLRLLNHSKSPNVKLDVQEACTPKWFEPVGHVQYGTWYTMSIKAIKQIFKGEELLIEYAQVPEEW